MYDTVTIQSRYSHDTAIYSHDTYLLCMLPDTSLDTLTIQYSIHIRYVQRYIKRYIAIRYDTLHDTRSIHDTIHFDTMQADEEEGEQGEDADVDVDELEVRYNNDTLTIH